LESVRRGVAVRLNLQAGRAQNRGAALKYSLAIHRRIVAAIKDGATQKAAARRAGITPETLSLWKTQFPDFGEDVERAHAHAQVLAETSLYKLAKRGNVRALIAWLEKRRPSEWGEKPLNSGVATPEGRVMIYLPAKEDPDPVAGEGASGDRNTSPQ